MLPFFHHSGIWWPYTNKSFPEHRLKFEEAYRGSKGNKWEVVPLGFSGISQARSVRRAKNRPAFDLNKPWIQFLFLLVAFLYGGLHCLAWNSVFPFYVQQLLWRISSVIIMAAGIPALVCYLLLEVVEFRYWETELSPSGPSRGDYTIAEDGVNTFSWLQKLSSRMDWYGSWTQRC
jgi:hypothetical protein